MSSGFDVLLELARGLRVTGRGLSVSTPVAPPADEPTTRAAFGGAAEPRDLGGCDWARKMHRGRGRRSVNSAHRQLDHFEVAVSHFVREQANTSCWLNHDATLPGPGSPRNATIHATATSDVDDSGIIDLDSKTLPHGRGDS